MRGMILKRSIPAAGVSRLASIAVGAALLALSVSASAAPAADADLIARGAYLAKAGDCIACHTATRGKPFSGGLPMNTPMGRIYSTNITPDAETGIARYSEADFAAAMRKGVAKDGHNLYPAMPYPSYARTSDADIHALYAYFMRGVQPVSQPNRKPDIPWRAECALAAEVLESAVRRRCALSGCPRQGCAVESWGLSRPDARPLRCMPYRAWDRVPGEGAQ